MRSNKRKNSGFTLVELVVAIAVLGVITAIVLPTVNNIQKNNLTKKYTTYENSILSSVKLYIDAYEEDEFDKNSLTPQCKAITYDDLKNHNLLKEYNVNGVSCKGKSVGDDNGIAAYVYKTNGKYEYYPMISCKKASSTESEYDSSQVVPNVCTNSSYSAYISGSTCFYKEPTVTLDLNHEGDSFKNIESMGYAVIDLNYKDDIEYIKNSTSYTNVELRNNSIDIELPEPENGESREYRLVLKYVYKNDDVKYEVKNNKLVVDYRKPTITISALKYKTNQAEGTKYNSGEWTNENVKVTVNVENGCGKQKGFEREYSTDTIADDKFSISYGKKGYESTVEKKIAVRIDKTPPTCTINLDGTKGNNNWYVSDVSLKLSKEDEKKNNVSSGIAEFGLARSSKPNYNKKELAEQEDDTTGEKWYGYVKDKAGNTAKCSKTIKKDTVAPTCKINKNGTLGNDNWYTSNVDLNLEKSDSGSGVDSYNLTTSSSVSYGSTSTATQTSDTSSQKWYGYIKDKAGNTAKCSTTLKKDSTPPSVPIITLKKWSDNSTTPSNSTYSSLTNYTAGTWSNMNIYTRASSSDSVSGISEYYYTTTGATSNTTNTSSVTRNIKASGTSYIKYRACDNAGNCSSYTKDYAVKIDKVAPNVPTSTVKVGATSNKKQNGYTTGWVNQKITWTDFDSSDSHSGIKGIYYSTSKDGTYKKFDEKSYSYSDTTKTFYIKAKDNAGNWSSVSSKYQFKSDTQKPTCSISLSGTKSTVDGWYTSNVTVKFESKSDSGGSGIKSYGLTTSTSASYNSETTGTQKTNTTKEGTTWYGYVKDNAGNTAKCSTIVKKDSTAPTTTNSCPKGETLFGEYKDQIPGNSLQDKDYRPKAWKGTEYENWCHSNGTCYREYGYMRVCIANWCKGDTAEDINNYFKEKYGEKTDCQYVRFWCSCTNSNF